MSKPVFQYRRIACFAGCCTCYTPILRPRKTVVALLCVVGVTMDSLNIESVAERVESYEQDGHSRFRAVEMALYDVKGQLGIQQ